MKHISRATNDPLGGNKNIYFIPDVDVTAVNRALASTVSIDYASGKKFYTMECVHETMKAVESGIRNALGTLYDIQVDAIISGNIIDNEESLNEMLGYKFILAREDNNCNLTILGNTEQPFDFKIEANSKEAIGQRNDIHVSFSGQCYSHGKPLEGTLEVYPD
jgi:hypothetical protein